jgi:CubicO group peptidase (beta-lactamase class C family)
MSNEGGPRVEDFTMEAVHESNKTYDFRAAHSIVQAAVDQGFLPGLSSAVLVGQDLVDVQCIGWADREADIPLRLDHIFRVFSNTKLVTACAALMLFEEGRFNLDDPIENYIPELANRRVLRLRASSLNDTEPATQPITVRQLMCHTAGLGSGVFDRGTLLFDAYAAGKVVEPSTSLTSMIDALADIPLAYQPGTSWAYSVASDVVARLVEVISAQPFDKFIQKRIFGPLGMTDTGFVVSDNSRFTAYYRGADPTNPMASGLIRADDVPYPGAFVKTFPRLNAGMGLVSTLPDQVTLIRSLCPGGQNLLEPETIRLVMTNQLSQNVQLQFPGFGVLDGKGFGLAGALILEPTAFESPQSKGELFWGGRGGTFWWISPRTNSAGVIMTQREMGHLSVFQFKRAVYEAVTEGAKRS